ncbi:probable alpha,alpha-trehalose-phosphate synthase [UDP-forming] 9 [Cajanus cajan]|uniref:alpha,alpha-trehalose-phosphate synthase (UDP-forming) n=1 Tax=Cajanus cajan TaxID=3821 RepID=A0A151SNC7_CAJCA|nr:probable alpha,alpha-trehalose-phosphate synthase [UDP-forming] 9 [Cajanus cajan]XP_020227408.1 probable alpha,alpha-trehalose-phosphate synthase [UDP-forming] 9 [Cajanus cajan]KYP56285.1 putative alpha,alpha-trehalose-phosphate synthase [UDP-forming] 9 [Cajanus cajan]
MVVRSSSNLSDLVTEDSSNSPHTPGALPHPLIVPGIKSDVDGKPRDNDDLNACSSEFPQKIIIVANFLPLHAQKDEISGKWCFTYDEDSILFPLKNGLSSDFEVLYVGSLKVDVETGEQEKVSLQLLEEFNCLPTFLPSEIHEQFYSGFCKQYLWPLFHYMLPLYPDYSNRFDRSLWQAYVSANKIFADKVMEVINPEHDYVWVHDYHLMVLATFLRKRYSWIKLGFFLHSSFPSSEIYRTSPVRDEILKALLNADLIGFHTFDYARHFLSCCSRILGLKYECKRGYIKLEYFGRTIFIKILPIGIHMGRLQSALSHPSFSANVRELLKFKGKKLILGVDDMDIFKGISLKLLAVEQLLQQYPELQGELILVQIVNPARSTGKDVETARNEMHITANRINERFGLPDYEPVIIINRHIPIYEKAAYYALAECCIVNAVRDGMNLVPYEYIVCRQGSAKMDEALEIGSESPRTSALVVSEFIGCSPSLSGAIRVNPWDINAVADALNLAITMSSGEKQLRHDKHYRYVSSHDVVYWAKSFVQDLENSCKDHYSKNCWGIGFGLNFRVLSLSPSFRKLNKSHTISAYERTNCRAIFLDYDGTIVPQTSITKIPCPEIIDVLNKLCSDPKNTVFIVSGREKTTLSEWFDQCENLGIAAEHGYFLKWSPQSTWEKNHISTNFSGKEIVEPVMRMYTEATDGSYIETKESALVWHYYNADPDFGSWQAKELLDHLENLFANEPFVVKKGKHIIEVKSEGITKGLIVEDILSQMTKKGKSPDFVLCIGDDRSDEDMFESLLTKAYGGTSSPAPEIFSCTVGQKPSKAKYYLDDTEDVMGLLQALGAISGPNHHFLKNTLLEKQKKVVST